MVAPYASIFHISATLPSANAPGGGVAAAAAVAPFLGLCRGALPGAECWILDGGYWCWMVVDDRRSEGMQLLIRFDCGGGGNRWSEINSLTRYQN